MGSKSGEMGLRKISPVEAYKMLKDNLEHTFLIDIRTRPEYEFVGHLPLAYNIPYEFWTPEGNKKNSNFVEDVSEKFRKDDVLIIMCRSGDRSRLACEDLEKASFKHVFDVPAGFEGKKVENKGSIYYGYHRRINGWQHDGLPYTYNINPRLSYKKKI